jgi:hypothetical protein
LTGQPVSIQAGAGVTIEAYAMGQFDNEIREIRNAWIDKDNQEIKQIADAEEVFQHFGKFLWNFSQELEGEASISVDPDWSRVGNVASRRVTVTSVRKNASFSLEFKARGNAIGYRDTPYTVKELHLLEEIIKREVVKFLKP